MEEVAPGSLSFLWSCVCPGSDSFSLQLPFLLPLSLPNLSPPFLFLSPPSSSSFPLFLPSSSLPLSPYQLPGDVKLTLSWAAMVLSRQGREGTECWSHTRESPPLTLLSLRSRYSWREADKITDEIKHFYKTIFSTSLPLSSFLSFLPPSLLSFLPFFVFIVYS